MLPRVTLIGRLIKDPEPAVTNNNLKYCRLSVVCSGYSTKTRKNEANFFDLTVWASRADFVEKYFRKGDIVAIDGTLSKTSYLNNRGETIYTTNINVREIERFFQAQKNNELDLNHTSEKTYYEPKIEEPEQTLIKMDSEINANTNLPPQNDQQTIVTGTNLQETMVNNIDIDDDEDDEEIDND